MPTAALGGRAEVMDYLAPVGPVYQAGTLSGNPVAMAAGVATLTHATDEVYSFVDARSLELSAALSSALDSAGVDHSIQRAGNLFSVAFGTSRPRRAQLRRRAGARRRSATRRSSTPCWTPGSTCRRRVFEAWFLSAAHDDAAMNRIFDALPAAAKAAAAAKA